MPSYNHGTYIQEAIDSVLCQAGVDLELLICDDGSVDMSAEVLRRQTDPRIHVTIHSQNRGACTVLNELIAQSKGEFIALINSDDVWQGTGKLAEQLDLLQTNPTIGASFGKAEFIDAKSCIIPNDQIAIANIFEQENRSRAKWLRTFFEYGNSICHPTMMIRKKCYTELGGYNNRFRQLPDFEMWTRLVKRYDIHISDSKWVRFRLIAGENTSSPTRVNTTRTVNELFLIMLGILEDTPSDMLMEMFPELLPQGQETTPAHFDIVKALAFFNTKNPSAKNAHEMMGLMKLKSLLDQADTSRILRDEYKVDDRWFHQKMGEQTCLTHGFAWESDTELQLNQAQNELNRLQQVISTQNDIIASLQREANRPLSQVVAKRLISKII